MTYTFTDIELAAECRREEGLRIGVYRKLVDNGRMDKDKADRQVAMMQAAAARFDSLSKAASPSPRAVALRKAISESRTRFSQEEVPLALVEAQSRLTILLLKGSPAAADVALEIAALAVRLSEGNTVVRELIVETNGNDAKANLVRLLNHPVITRQEKTKGLLKVNMATDEELQQMVAEHTALINTREGLDVEVAARAERLAS